ncbi:hypothetical protein [Streptomyces eurythermus]
MTVRATDWSIARYSARSDGFVPFVGNRPTTSLGHRYTRTPGRRSAVPVQWWSVGEEVGRLLTIDVAVPLAVVVFFRPRRRTRSRSRNDEKPTVVIGLAPGILDVLEELASGVTQAGR